MHPNFVSSRQGAIRRAEHFLRTPVWDMRRRTSRDSSSSSSSSSDSEDSEEERRREEKRRRKIARRKQHREEREQEEAAAEQRRKQTAALQVISGIPYSIKDEINCYEEPEEGEDDDLLSTLEIRARKPENAPAEVKDMSNWAEAEKYLREKFDIDSSVEKVALIVQYFDPRSNSSPKL